MTRLWPCRSIVAAHVIRRADNRNILKPFRELWELCPAFGGHFAGFAPWCDNQRTRRDPTIFTRGYR